MIAVSLGVAASPQTAKPARWFRGGIELRGRAEGFTGLGYVPANDDFYYLSRIRLKATITATPWLKFFGMLQDSEAPGFRSPVPGNVANTVDLHQGYAEFGDFERGKWGVRAGRQKISFGDERLIGLGDWGNVGRNFDGLRVAWQSGKTRADLFATTVVTPLRDRFDRPRNAARLHGLHWSFADVAAGSTAQPYFFWKSVQGTDVYTSGVRALGKLPVHLDYNTEMALQFGEIGSRSLHAWAGHWVLGFRLPGDDRAPRLVAEYNYASGDSDPLDNNIGTFDQLYPTNHSKYGTADRIAWRNIHDAMGGIECRPGKQLLTKLDFHSFWLATRRDALYTEAGAVVVRNPAAGSAHVGNEIDLQVAWRASEHWQFAFGIAHMFPGQYLKESTGSSRVTAPYAMWTWTY